MRVCFVVSEIFHWGRHGGFGALTRTIGSNLVEKGIEVYVATTQRKGQKPVETLDGMVVLGYPPHLHSAFSPSVRARIKSIDADVYHSEQPIVSSYIAIKAAPHRKHIITFQDPVGKEDRTRMEAYAREPPLPWFKSKVYAFLSEPLRRKAIRMADALYCQAKYIIPKVMAMYGLSVPPCFLPNPVEVERKTIKKAAKPTVCFVARWDLVKRPELFFKLAKEFPDVKFIAIGRAHDEKRDRYLRQRYSGIPNLEVPGFVSEEEKYEILKRSWIMINTSVHECLPVSFLEAAANKCAILSSENPDDFAENFGYHVKDDKFSEGLRFLLEDDRWKERGERGFRYVKEIHELNKVVDRHIKAYEKLLNG